MTSIAKFRLLSGIKPTGDIHIGNYFGAIRQFLDLQNEYDSHIFIADLHALNQIHQPESLRGFIKATLTAYLAVGLDPEKVVLFQQSAIPAHAELTWIFNCIVSMGQLERGHAYKDAQAKEKAVNVGLFDYPVLMAADILLYKPAIVPVGKDQQQHLEMAIDIAERFNHLFGETFPIPKPLILPEVATIPGLDGRKMSKSYNNVIGLFDPPELIRKKVMGIVTDSKSPSESKDPYTSTVYQLLALANPLQAVPIRQRFIEGTISYKEAKELLADALITLVAPFQTKKAELDAKPGYLAKVIQEGTQRAALLANQTLQEVKEVTGLTLRF